MTRELPRQVFVRGALGAVATAVLGACGAPTPPRPATTPAEPGHSAPDWSKLAAAVDGAVVLRGDDGYPAAKTVFNTRFAGSTPAAVVAVTSVEDVRTALRFASSNGVAVTARSGGHSYVGASAADATLVVDLRRLPGGVTYDDGTGRATVSSAADISSIQNALNAFGRSIPTGSCPSVGVAGLTLGGGLGADARRYGLTCDALVAATVVLPDGETVTASPGDDADLFWALRGGGANNGIVTSFTFDTFPTTDRDVVTLVFGEDAAARVLVGWHQWLLSADRAVWGMVNLTVGPGRGRCSVVLATPAGDGPALAAGVAAAVGVPTVGRTIRTLDHLGVVAYFGGGPDAVRPRAFVAGSDVVARMTPAAAESIVAATSAWPRAGGAATAVVESLDGAIGDVDPAATAFPWRRHAASVQWYAETPTPELTDAADRWLTAAHAALGGHSAGGYVNYLEPSTPAMRYFGANLPRLAAARRRCDPHEVMFSSLRF
ncbi:FAD-binding oxidoreductase [Mycobacterium hodleri]|uniref:FAD-binding oxidoreductase n=1 Tax=Mycolicibacterium hodleri TaxID=49897 RepID=A0A544W353_9MYCO|nr:FAD-binding oxidoreductase [Mycolicibacterium hodleri]TQR86689.1 FAD-binding oxidoreductase [Mycolicibacterium hodleri]